MPYDDNQDIDLPTHARNLISNCLCYLDSIIPMSLTAKRSTLLAFVAVPAGSSLTLSQTRFSHEVAHIFLTFLKDHR